MMKIIDTGCDRTIGVRIGGKISKAELELAIADIKARLDQFETLTAYVEVESLEGMELGALYEDLKFGIPNARKFTRKAVVSDKQWMATLARWGDKLMPGLEVRHYQPEQRTEAIAWANGESE